VVLGVYGIAANLAIAAFPVGQWTTAQNARFVAAESALSIDSLGGSTRVGHSLPYWAPAGQLFAVNHCSGLYLSTGNSLKHVPGQQIEHDTWMPVEQSPAFTRTIGFTFNRSADDFSQAVPLMTYGASTLMLEPYGRGHARIVIANSGTAISWPPATGWIVPIKLLHEQYQVTVTTDPNLQSITVNWYGSTMINHFIAGDGLPVVVPTSTSGANAASPVVTVADVPTKPAKSPMHLCRTLVGNR
jgi:hypothetical protein